MKNQSQSIFFCIYTLLLWVFPSNVEAQDSLSENNFTTQQITFQEQDSLTLLKNYSLYREYYKAGNIEEALPYWKWIIQHAPKFRKTVYKDGWNIYEQMAIATADSSIRRTYINSMLLMYDKRIEHFGQEGIISAWKALKVKKYLPENKELYNELVIKSVEVAKENTPYFVLGDYIKIKYEELYPNVYVPSKADTFTKYCHNLLQIIQHNIETGNKFADKYQQAQEKIERYHKLFMNESNNPLVCGVRDCNAIVQRYGAEYRANPDDINIVKKFVEKLSKSRCKSHPIYEESLTKLFELKPTASSARRLAGFAYKKGKIEETEQYFLQSIDLDTSKLNQAKIYMNLATMTRLQTRELTEEIAIKARNYAYKAIELQPNWGKPYLFIGKLYSSSTHLCDDDIRGRPAIWAAVDMWEKAKTLDTSCSLEAQELIDKYSIAFPSKDGVICGKPMPEGSKFDLSNCWIGGKTTVRYSN